MNTAAVSRYLPRGWVIATRSQYLWKHSGDHIAEELVLAEHLRSLSKSYRFQRICLGLPVSWKVFQRILKVTTLIGYYPQFSAN